MKKRFNTNIDEEKLEKLKEIADYLGIGANDLIEKLVDEYEDVYLENKPKTLNFSTQIPYSIVEYMREEKNINIENYEILQSLQDIYNHYEEYQEILGFKKEIQSNSYLLNKDTNEIYQLNYYLGVANRDFLGEDKVSVLFDKVTLYDTETIIKNLEYTWKKKDEYQVYDRQITINNIGARLIKFTAFPRYSKEKVLIHNYKLINKLKEIYK